jgi:lysophospholipase L1-like esterase
MDRLVATGLALAVVLAASATFGAPGDNALGLHSDGGGWGFRRATNSVSALPRVLLVGDSVMNSYRGEVTRLLDGKATVDTWATGMFLGQEHLFSDLIKVLGQGPYAVIHFNIGLHDWPEGRIPPEEYAPRMVRYFSAYLSSAPTARLIWASSTPVTAKGDKALDPKINPVIVRQNEIAARVAQARGIPVNDLYALGAGNLALARGDQFHWTPAGARVLAGQVAREITAALAAPAGVPVR